jgi:hypothetical protein
LKRPCIEPSCKHEDGLKKKSAESTGLGLGAVMALLAIKLITHLPPASPVTPENDPYPKDDQPNPIVLSSKFEYAGL